MVLVHAIDDIVLVVYLLVTLSITVSRGLRRRQPPQSALMTSGPGSGHTSAPSSVVAVAASVMATFMSAVFMLGESSSYQEAICIVTLNG